MTHGRISSLLVSLLFFNDSIVSAMLNLSPSTGEDVVANMRKHIFVDRRQVGFPDTTKVCDSLSGPTCGAEGLKFASVIPFEYTGDLEVDFNVVHAQIPADLWNMNYTLEDSFVPSFKLDLQNTDSKNRIAHHYSLMPPVSGGVVADLEGRWLLEDDSVSMETSLPGYISFSSPVLVKSLWVHLPYDYVDDTDPSVLVVFRHGTETVWSTRVVMKGGYTVDLTSLGSDDHGPLRLCDTIVLFSTIKGLKVVSVDLQEIQSTPNLVPSLLLIPTLNGVALRHVAVDKAAIATKQLISIHEVINQGLTVRPTGNEPAVPLTLLELMAKDMGFMPPIAPLMVAVKNGDMRVPHELRKALLKHEKEVYALANTMTKSLQLGRELLFRENSSLDHPLTNESRKVVDLVIAALIYL